MAFLNPVIIYTRKHVRVWMAWETRTIKETESGRWKKTAGRLWQHIRDLRQDAGLSLTAVNPHSSPGATAGGGAELGPGVRGGVQASQALSLLGPSQRKSGRSKVWNRKQTSGPEGLLVKQDLRGVPYPSPWPPGVRQQALKWGLGHQRCSQHVHYRSEESIRASATRQRQQVSFSYEA